MTLRSPITTHVLDLSRGKPAQKLAVALDTLETGGQWRTLARGETDADGRIEDLLAPGTKAKAGVYRLVFETGLHYQGQCFYPSVTIQFELTDPSQHYHVPLLLNAYGYSTYRGS
jgi:5-hydroxyisourate hydrolase